MPRIKLISTNRKISTLITLIIIFFSLMTILFPLLLLRLIPQSGIGHYFLEHLYYGYFSIPILLYIFYTGVYFYKIKIDSYIIDVRSYRTISGIFQPPNYIDIAHAMLSDFSFFNRPFSFNKTLMIKIKTDTGKQVSKRFNLTFLSKKEEEKISKVLEQIIAKNS
jgi:hypothetical protein